ncbi:MAG TPA: Gfo/Idh/MocA family oxidoreductase [Anaerohalosphaeraceae bacterium]|jgi:predicted dehydrogenase|nr:Gfo/Idh/MocA family oxidoreductase [Anaerohalosphaeraceae bacterium]
MNESMNRREFVKTSAAIGAGLFVTGKILGAGGSKDTLNIAFLGAGAQGQALLDATMKLGPEAAVRIMAVCDIWEKVNLRRVSRRIQSYKAAYGHEGRPYVDYKEMLDTEKDLDAVIIATPDFCHAEQTIACLEKGLHVYCEKEMSNTLEGARQMLEAANRTGKLLQIGHQRRSNPRYRYCFDKYIQEAKPLGRITTINGQWNRSKASCEDLDWPEGMEIDEATLNKYGFQDMHQFRNWRWFKGLGGGPIVDLGSHQIDIYNWYLGAVPRSVMASGGNDYWKNHQWYDSVMAVYEYLTKDGPVRAFYQTLTTSSANGYYESFMGLKGTLVISESANRGSVYRESWVPEEDWDPWVTKGYLKKVEGKTVVDNQEKEEAVLDVREGTFSPAEYKIPVTMNVPYHQPHIQNFLEAVRGREKLNCPAQIGYETAVTVLKVNEAIEKGCRLEFKTDEFTV